MRKVTFLVITIIGISFAFSCTNNGSETVVEKQEIEKYLSADTFKASTDLKNVEKSIAFWLEKTNSSPNSMTYNAKLASAYNQRFGITKDINDLHKADSLYKVSLNASGGKTPENIQALSQLAITKHQFKQAQEYAFDAFEEGYEKSNTYALLYDVMMERGDYKLAKENLDRFTNTSSFGYLIRMSKYKDYEGDLDAAIKYMEQAAERVDHNSNLSAWSSSNLGDMYGHANRIQDSYDHYIKALEGENTGGSYLHSLQGLAWIAYAHDKNFELATEILEFVDQQVQSPDVKMTLAEIAEYQGNKEQKLAYLKDFVNEAKKPVYFGMYDAYLIDIAANSELKNTQWAMDLVEKELENRPSPQVYDLQAWTYFHQGNHEKALEIVQNHVEGQTYEPVPAYHMAKIYKANGMDDKARPYFEESLGAAYELGLVTKRDVEQELETL